MPTDPAAIQAPTITAQPATTGQPSNVAEEAMAVPSVTSGAGLLLTTVLKAPASLAKLRLKRKGAQRTGRLLLFAPGRSRASAQIKPARRFTRYLTTATRSGHSTSAATQSAAGASRLEATTVAEGGLVGGTAEGTASIEARL